jgi:hypothetical protein
MRAFDRSLAERFVSEIRCFGYGLEVAELLVASSAGATVEEVSVLSKPQARNTAAQKIADNISVLLSTRNRCSVPQRLELCRVMAALTSRREFVIAGDVFGLNEDFRCRPIAEDEDGEFAIEIGPTH